MALTKSVTAYKFERVLRTKDVWNNLLKQVSKTLFQSRNVSVSQSSEIGFASKGIGQDIIKTWGSDRNELYSII